MILAAAIKYHIEKTEKKSSCVAQEQAKQMLGDNFTTQICY